MGLKGNTTVGREVEASTAIVPSGDDTSFCDLSIAIMNNIPFSVTMNTLSKILWRGHICLSRFLGLYL